MNSKSCEQYKSAAISQKPKKNKKGEPEVLIIPPNLLEKFGFTLGDIHTFGEISTPESSNNTHSNICPNKPNLPTETKEKEELSNINKHTSTPNETSILETANLMKESVFLSPTFVSTVSNAITGEVEIISSSGKPLDQNNASNINNDNIGSIPTGYKKLLPLENQEHKNTTVQNVIYNEHNILETCHKDSKEITKSTVISQIEAPSVSSFGNQIKGENLILQTEQPDEDKESHGNKYLSNVDCENLEFNKPLDDLNSIEHNNEERNIQIEYSMFECGGLDLNVASKSTILNSVDSKQKTQHESQKKIKIISEEILNYKLLPEHKVIKSPHRNSLILVSMDTIIAKKDKTCPTLESFNIGNSKLVETVNTVKCGTINRSEQRPASVKDNVIVRNSADEEDLIQIQPELSLNEISNDHSMPFIESVVLDDTNETIVDDDYKHVLSDDFNKTNVVEKNNCEFKLNINNNDSDASKINHYFVSTKLNSDIDLEHGTNENSTIVKGALYDTIIMEDNNKFSFDLIRNKETPLSMPPNYTENTKCSINNQSQLCVDRIKSPGENEEFRKCTGMKTYLPRKISRTKQTSINIQNQIKSRVTKKVDAITLNNDTYVDTCLKTLQYCVCDDFGTLKNFNYPISSHEHIHFSHTEKVNCDPEIIYGIYSDSILFDSRHNYEITEITSSENEISNICWNGIHTQSYTNSNEMLSKALFLSTSKERSSHEETENRTINIEENVTTPQNNKMTIQMSINKNNFGINRFADKMQQSSAPIDQKETILVGNSKKLKTSNAPSIVGPIQNPSKFTTAREIYIVSDEESVVDLTTVSNLNSADDAIVIAPAQIFTETVKDEKIANHFSEAVFSGMNTSMALIKSKYNSSNHSESSLSPRVIGVEVDHLSNFENTAKNQTRTPKKVYPSIARGSKRNMNDNILDSMPESIGKKHCDSVRNTSESPSHVTKWSSSKTLECGKCQSLLATDDWEKHVFHTHLKCNITQKKDLQSDDFHEELNEKLKEAGILNCDLCLFKVNHVPTFILHIEQCIERSKKITTIFAHNKESMTFDTVRCGVCKNIVRSKSWIHHIKSKHSYLAWKDNEPKLNLSNEDEVRQHLHFISKEEGALTCVCGFAHKYAKSFINHINTCAKKVAIASRQYNGILCKTQTEISNSDSKADTGKSELDNVLMDQDNSVAANIDHMKSEYVECGVCKRQVDAREWISHIQTEHNYLAWKIGETPLNVNKLNDVINHLKEILKQQNSLLCGNCGISRKFAKCYLSHVNKCNTKMLNESDLKDCDSTLNSSQLDNSDISLKELSLHKTPKRARLESVLSSSDSEDNGSLLYLSKQTLIVCGVCEQELQGINWFQHIKQQHNYLAWKTGESPISLDNEESVRQHLYLLSKKLGGLCCSKCNFKHKYVKRYLEHIRTCNELDAGFVDEVAVSKENDETTKSKHIPLRNTVKCGVCKEEIPNKHWTKHLQKEHNYLAWKDEELSVNLDNEEEMRKHLNTLAKTLDGLVCRNCKCVCKNGNTYLDHIKTCAESNVVDIIKKEDLPDTAILEDIVKCGVCSKEIQESLWIDHIENEHNYLAWKDGEPALNLEDEDALRQHLVPLAKKLNGLFCSKCKCIRKYVKKYLEHIKICDGKVPEHSHVDEEQDNVGANGTIKLIKCGVCETDMKKKLWLSHIEKEHNYLAWKMGETPLDLKDEELVRQHLYTINKSLGGLTCSKCGTIRKYVKSYLEHLKYCEGAITEKNNHSLQLNNTIDSTLNDNETKCGVCSKIIQPGNWIKHIQVAHNYLAWKDGAEPIDTNNDDAVREHLYQILKIVPTLTCPKCGLTRRIAKYYQNHMKTCNIETEGDICEDKKALLLKNEGLYECAVCHEKVTPEEWNRHAMDRHYNVAWVVGDIPINLKSPYGAERYLRKYKEKKGKLVCMNCGASRASLMGFYVHIITCGKTEEEIAVYKDECEICGKLYLGVYKTQHLLMHREKELSDERKSKKTVEIKTEDENMEIVPGRRKAAQKAKIVIEKYKTNSDIHDFNCDNCDFSTDTKKEFLRHKCNKDDEEEVLSSEDDSEDLSTDGDNSSNESDESEIVVPKKRSSDANRVSWLPFQPTDKQKYLQRAIRDFRAAHFTDQILFVDWKSFSYECLECEDEVIKYTPKTTQSCKVNINKDWLTYNRFQGKYDREVYSLFVGGSIQCISWAPPSMSDNHLDNNYLAVAGHLDSDTPRINSDELAQHPGLIQIWTFDTFSGEIPKFVLGLVHDYGTVWSIDWCPSGVRDEFNIDTEEKELLRLGLMAVACSNGSAYIYSVPYPECLPNSAEKLFFKLKPVAELRFNMKPGKTIYQATSLSWSKKNGHSVVAVGYADGHVALFDVTSMSPLLRSTENDTTIFYPYNDVQMLSSCITAVDTFPSRNEHLPDAVCGASPTGAAAGVGAGAVVGAGGRVVCRLPADFAAFMPTCPIAMLGGDDGLVNNTYNELEWHGCGRRLGGIRTGAGCRHCGRVLIYVPPLLRTMRNFPPCTETKKTTVATINLKPLSLKRQKEKYKNDELSMKVEPTTYDDVVNKYGVEFTVTTSNLKPSNVAREPFPERFPLADVTSLAYCPSGNCHEMAAVAIHAGLIFVFKTR